MKGEITAPGLWLFGQPQQHPQKKLFSPHFDERRNLKVAGLLILAIKWPEILFSGDGLPCMGFHGCPKQGEGISGRYKKLTW